MIEIRYTDFVASIANSTNPYYFADGKDLTYQAIEQLYAQMMGWA